VCARARARMRVYVRVFARARTKSASCHQEGDKCITWRGKRTSQFN